MFKKYWNGLYNAEESWRIYRNINFLIYLGYFLPALFLIMIFPNIGTYTGVFSGYWLFFTTIPCNAYLTVGIWRSLHYDYCINEVLSYTIEQRVQIWSGISAFVGVGLIVRFFAGLL